MNKRSSQTGTKHKESGLTDIGGMSLIKSNLLAMIVAVGILLFSGFIAYMQYTSLIASSTSAKHKQEAEALATHLAGRLHALGDMVAKFAVPDPALVAAIQNRDIPVLRAHEAEIMRIFPDANRVRIILPGEDQVDNTVSPPLSYACLELARLAEQGGALPPFEVHLFGGEIEHVDMLRPIIHNNKLIASLIVTQDVDNLKNWIDDLQTDGGYVELEQGVENDVIRLFGQGDASSRDSGKPYSAAIENSYWLLNYWPSSGIGATEARHAGFIITFSVAAGVLIVFFISYGVFISSMVRSDMRRMINYIIDFSLGKRFQNYPVRMAEAKKVLQEKENDLSVLTDFADNKTAIHDKAEHFMPDISFGETGISVEEVVAPKANTGGTEDNP